MGVRAFERGFEMVRVESGPTQWQLIWQRSAGSLCHATTLCRTNASDRRIRASPDTPWQGRPISS